MSMDSVNLASDKRLHSRKHVKVLVIGKNGQLARELTDTVPTDVELTCLSRTEIDLTEPSDIIRVISTIKPNIIINVSGFTDVEAAESSYENAHALNGKAVDNIAYAAFNAKVRLIHISTDFIFDGCSQRAYKVDDKPNPINVYGKSKLAGEVAIAKYHSDNFTIVRTSWLYSRFGKNFVKTMLNLMSEKEQLNIVNDQLGSPTHAKGLAYFLWCLIKLEKWQAIYHWSDLGITSWYEFAIAIQELGIKHGVLQYQIPIKPILSVNYPSLAKRPSFSALDCTASQMILTGKAWQDGLTDFIKQLKPTS